MIFAFLPFMLHTFFPNLKAEQVGEMISLHTKAISGYML